MLYPSGLASIDLSLCEWEKREAVHVFQLAQTLKAPVRALGFEPKTFRA
jgi:hypothetical protein